MQRNTSFMAAALVLAVPLALAETGRADDAGAAVPATAYQSAFSDYQPAQESALKDWREANAEVSGGGHMHQGHDMGDMHQGHDMSNMHEGHDMGAMPSGMDHSMHQEAVSTSPESTSPPQHGGHQH